MNRHSQSKGADLADAASAADALVREGLVAPAESGLWTAVLRATVRDAAAQRVAAERVIRRVSIALDSTEPQPASVVRFAHWTRRLAAVAAVLAIATAGVIGLKMIPEAHTLASNTSSIAAAPLEVAPAVVASTSSAGSSPVVVAAMDAKIGDTWVVSENLAVAGLRIDKPLRIETKGGPVTLGKPSGGQGSE